MKQSIVYGFEKARAPFLVLSCDGLDMYFLVDTGSTDNHLLSGSYEFLKEVFPDHFSEKPADTIYSTAGIGCVLDTMAYEFSFDLSDQRYKEYFSILPTSEAFIRISTLLGKPVWGVLGCGFLRKHHIVIDYGDLVIYNKEN